MKYSPIVFFFSLFVSAGLSLSSYSQEKVGDAAKKTDKKGSVVTGEKEKKGKGLQIGKLLPLNKPNLRVKIPGFDDGKLASMIEAAKLTRIDDSNLRLEDATIQLIPQELTIKLRSALYNTDGAILSSNEKTTISSKQFTITGETMDFNTRTGKGRMMAKKGGVVRMIIHNLGSMDGAKKPVVKKAATTTISTNQEESKK